jgi:hypothetical protein
MIGLGIGVGTLDPGTSDNPSATSLSMGAGLWFVSPAQSIPIDDARKQVDQYEQQYRQAMDAANAHVTQAADTAAKAVSRGRAFRLSRSPARCPCGLVRWTGRDCLSDPHCFGAPRRAWFLKDPGQKDGRRDKTMKGDRMFRPWYDLTMLAVESQQVIGLRLLRLSLGGARAREEATRMVFEKVTAADQAVSRLIRGASPDSIVQDYRDKVRLNVARLSSPAASQVVWGASPHRSRNNRTTQALYAAVQHVSVEDISKHWL